MCKHFIYFAIIAFFSTSPLVYAEESESNGASDAWKKPILNATSGQNDVDIEEAQVQNKRSKVKDLPKNKQSSYRLTPIAVPGRLLKPTQRFRFQEIVSDKKKKPFKGAVPKPTKNGVFEVE